MRVITVSLCHEADVFYTEKTNGHRTAYCTHCQQPCKTEDVCEECRGTGKISTDESDGEGHIMRGVGTAKCPFCQD